MNDVLDFLPVGADKSPTSREELVMLTGMTDRTVREEINRLKKDYPIINVGQGYYIANDPDDPNLKAYIVQETHRIRAISKGLRRHKKLYKINKEQEVLDI